MKKASIFGKYLLLERLNVGGMAEVFIAKTSAVVEGVERFVAIKKILPTMAEDEDFIRMFIDEARISVQLNHANIVHIHELGRADDTYFIAMEYVAGKDVRTLLERYRRRKEIMPTAQAVFIASKMCEALDYAHRKKDARGQELGIIHRDVSPQNILVSYEGEVKIIDFGIAKAANRSQKTQAGILKGKFGYMSPEQVRGQPIDRRSDIFAVGVLLYEMITGEKLFTGDSDYSVLEKVRNATVPAPRQFNPNIPAGLERVLNKALARDPEQRYQWAADLHEDLVRFLVAGDQVYTSKLLSTFMKEAFSDELANEAASMERYSRVGGAEESELVIPRRTPPTVPATTTEEFGVEGGEDQVDKTQVISSAMVDAIAHDGGAVPEAAAPVDATRADMVSPFLEDEKTVAPPSRTPSTGRSGQKAPVMPSSDAYAGATMISAAPSYDDLPSKPVVNERTRVLDTSAQPKVLPPTQMMEAPSYDDDDLPQDDAPDEHTEAHDDYSADEEDDTDAHRRIDAEDLAEHASEDEDPEQTQALSEDDEPAENTSPEEEPEEPTSSEVAPKPAPIWMQRKVQIAAGAGLVLLLVIILAAVGGKKSGGQPVVLKVQPANAKVLLDQHPVQNGVVTMVTPGRHEASFSAPGYVAQSRNFIAEANKQPMAIEVSLEAEAPAAPVTSPAPTDQQPPAVAQQETGPATATPEPVKPEAPKSFTVKFECDEDGVEIAVEGKSIGKTPTASLANLTFGKTYRYTAKLTGFKTKSGTFSSDQNPELSVPVELEKVEPPAHHEKVVSVVHKSVSHSAPEVTRAVSHRKVVGWLACSTRPAGADIWVDNHPTGRQTPVALSSPLSLPAGSHTVVFKMGSRRSEPQTVVINEKETAKLVNVPLQ